MTDDQWNQGHLIGLLKVQCIVGHVEPILIRELFEMSVHLAEHNQFEQMPLKL